MTVETFINKARITHGDKYDYSLIKKVDKYVDIICPIHGKFTILASEHIYKKGGCKKCYLLKRTKTIDKFIEDSKIVHGDKYDYSLSVYVNWKTELKIICPKHGVFEQRPAHHVSLKQGCPKCKIEQQTLTKEEFIIKSKLIHGDKYNYSLVDYINNSSKVIILCPKHGEFKQTPINHLKGNGCEKCKTSKGEIKIINYLEKHNIKYVYQNKFEDCKNIRKLVFDFYLPDYNLCIEYDGVQHFKEVKNFGGKKGYDNIKKRDIIKNNYCLINNIFLLRIKYTDNVEEKLIDYFEKNEF
jgi:hypothetical protein